MRRVHCAQAAWAEGLFDRGRGAGQEHGPAQSPRSGSRPASAVRFATLSAREHTAARSSPRGWATGSGREPSPLECWRAIERSFRLASIQGTQVVIGIDDGENASGQVLREIESLASVGAGLNMRLTIIRAGRRAKGRQVDPALRRSPAIGLEPSTLPSGGRCYPIGKLADAGCNAAGFHAACGHAAALPDHGRPSWHRPSCDCLLDCGRGPRTGSDSA